jgi:pimeloyl-ACP methyl ester carboxylesterase
MVGLVSSRAEKTAVIAGHDWGAPVAWHADRRRRRVLCRGVQPLRLSRRAQLVPSFSRRYERGRTCRDESSSQNSPKTSSTSGGTRLGPYQIETLIGAGATRCIVPSTAIVLSAYLMSKRKEMANPTWGSASRKVFVP